MKDHFKRLVQKQLHELGEKSIAAATRRGLPRDTFRSILKGHPPGIDRAAEICRALGLEFYIGLPRDGAAPSSTVLSDKADRAGTVAPLPALAAHLSAAREELTCAEAIHADLVKHQFASNLDDTGALVGAVDDDDEPPPGARHVGVVETEAAAGGGGLIEDAPVKGKVWFRRDWLDSHALDPTRCVVMGVKGESMEPVLMDGASILVDRKRTRRRAGHIYVIRTGDGLVAKRLADGDDGWRLVSEHPQWSPVPWEDDMEIVGEVRWTARTIVLNMHRSDRGRPSRPNECG